MKGEKKDEKERAEGRGREKKKMSCTVAAAVHRVIPEVRLSSGCVQGLDKWHEEQESTFACA